MPASEAAETRWVNPLFEPLEVIRNGPFLALPEGRLLSADEESLLASSDEGRTWEVVSPLAFGQHPKEPASFYFLRTRSGVLVMVYLDLVHSEFHWDDERGEPVEPCRLELWAARSLDDGQTWVDRQCLMDGRNANFFGLIQTSTGRLVLACHHLVPHPGRWIIRSFASDDDGQTWTGSNWIDLGGHGHHDGATEPGVTELSDGRLLMLIRTNLDRFWYAFSEDGGRYWRTLLPSPIDASSAPGYLLRLQSGRHVLVWNRLNPEGGTWKRRGPDVASELPTSWYREELSIAISEDDAQTWSRPLVIARQVGGQLSYPFVLERRPGELWITAGFAFRKDWEAPLPLRVKVTEEELLRELG